MLRITELKKKAHFYSLRKCWTQILYKSDQDTIFMTWDWLYTWWEIYSAKKQLSILLIQENDGDIVGIAPFYTTHQKSLGVPMRVLKLIGSEEVCSEYLDIIFFLFTISNSIEALHFVLYQHNFNVFINGQIISLVINILLLFFWVKRFLYLHTKIAKENERFLENYYFLGGLVAKPHPNWFSEISQYVSVKVLALVLVILAIGIVTLFLVKQITFYLFINTIFLVLAIVLALFFGFSSIRRQWNSTFGRLINKK